MSCVSEGMVLDNKPCISLQRKNKVQVDPSHQQQGLLVQGLILIVQSMIYLFIYLLPIGELKLNFSQYYCYNVLYILV